VRFLLKTHTEFSQCVSLNLLKPTYPFGVCLCVLFCNQGLGFGVTLAKGKKWSQLRSVPISLLNSVVPEIS
jgi:hypothetical protein